MSNEEFDQKIQEIERQLDQASAGIDFMTLMQVLRSIIEIIKTLRGRS